MTFNSIKLTFPFYGDLTKCSPFIASTLMSHLPISSQEFVLAMLDVI